LIISAEEHNIVGGLGTAIADVLAEEGGYPPLLKLGVKDRFSKPGDYDYVMHQHRLSPELIAEDIKNKLQSL
jgi:transketolase